VRGATAADAWRQLHEGPQKKVIQPQPLASFLRVLILEDSPEEAELLSSHLRQHGFQMDYRRVETLGQFVEALVEFQPNLILSEYILRQFGAPHALQILLRRHRDTPFIVVATKLTEKAITECLRAGADDFVLKDRLERLSETVQYLLESDERLAR
jgi:CheY-like chemotaxis protein